MRFLGLYILQFILGAYPALSQTDELRACVLSSALSQVGVREATGNNDGYEIRAYLHYTGLKEGNPYCAAFCCWCFAQSCIDNPRSAWSPSMFPKDKVIYDRSTDNDTAEFKEADVFGIYFNNLNRIAHVGLIESENEGVVRTVEANTDGSGGRDGDGVYKRKRFKRQIYKVSRWIN